MLEFDRLQNSISEHAFYDSLARFPPPRCYPETRVDVLQKITDWIDGQDPGKHIFWLNGPAGGGKTAITQTTAELCNGTQLAASFFFQRNTSDRGVADRLFLTLAWQLAMSIPETRPYLESTLKAERSIHAKSIDVQFDLLFVQVFKKLFHDSPELRPKRSLIIIDALDECATDLSQRDILTLIGAQTSKNFPLRFLISSRPEPNIEETFAKSMMRSVTRVLVLDRTFAPNDDIQRYLTGELYRIFTERGIPPLPTITDIINRLVLISSGQFIYASTVIKFVDDRDHDPERRLSIILGTRRSTTPPYGQLDQLYLQILSQQQNIWLLKGVFVLILAFGQVDLHRTCLLLWIREEDLKLKLRRMHSLLHISDSGIKPYHLSFVDFLQHKQRAGKYHIHSFVVQLMRLPLSIDQALNWYCVIPIMQGIKDYGVTEPRWSKPGSHPIFYMIFGLDIAVMIIFIGLVIWNQRKQKEAVIRGLLAEPAI